MKNTLNYEDSGSGLPVVLIHGFPLNRSMWQPQVKALADAGCRVICPDLPGFGQSPVLEGDASMDRYADAVMSLLDELGIEQAVIGGMSMGGYVLLTLVARYPQRLLGAMYLVTRAAADDPAGKEKRSMLAQEVAAGDTAIVPDSFAQVLFAPHTAEEKPGLVKAVRQMMESASAGGVVGGLLAMRDRDDFVDRLPGLGVPALVVGAELDAAVPIEHARLLAQGLPDAQLEIIAGAGHMVNLERPEEFNQAIIKFIHNRGHITNVSPVV